MSTSTENKKTEKVESRVLRLAKPVKKGLLHLVFSRFLLIFLLMVAQVLLAVVMFDWARGYLPHLQAGLSLFTVVMVIYLFNSEMDDAAKLTWMFLIALLPIPGALFLAFTQLNLGHRAVKSRVETLIGETKDAIPQDPQVLKGLGKGTSGLDDLSRYLGRSGCFPVYHDTAADYFPSGETKFEAMLEELEKAERYIFLEYFIIEEGYMWGRVLEILSEKAAQGVDVRVMYDGMCELFNLPGNYIKLLEKLGIRAKEFAPIRPVVSSHYNYRDHRKILVIDGKVGFIGSVNLADEYINRIERFGHWKDAAVRLRGNAVRSLTLMFLQMWNIDEKEPEFLPYIMDDAGKPETKGGYIMPYADCPLDQEKAGETVYMDMLYRAIDYVHIMTPYLILDGELETALRYAAERGVDVKLILPGIPDKKMAYALAKSHYRALTASGVKIYEYTPGFIHSKVCVSDDKRAVVGTINLDYRSLYHHFECAVYLYKDPCIADAERDFQETLAECRPVTPETIKNEKLYYKIMGPVLKFIAPLM